MARMIPELDNDQLGELRSRAEARFYVACRDQLPQDVLVIHSVGWIYRDGKGRLREGEADFTICDPKSGVFAIEVKGGGVAFDAPSGKWHSVDREGKRNEIKDPFRQATNERHALVDQINAHPRWRQWPGRRLCVGHAVMLTDIKDSAPIQAPDRPRQTIGVAVDLSSLRTWMEGVARFWKHPDDNPIGSAGVQLVEEILSKSIEVRPILRGAVDEAEQRRIRLTSNQTRVLRVIGARKRAVISGGAGTGKTLIAVEKARRLAAEGLRVLLLCYNRPLADVLAASLQQSEQIDAMTFHQLCDRRVAAATRAGRDLMQEARKAYPGSDTRHLFDVQMPFALALSNEVLDDRYGAIVVDEAQDFSDEYWFGLEDLLQSTTDGFLYVFTDPNQTIYPRRCKYPVLGEPFNLTTNCRNTSPIHRVGYVHYSGELIDPPELDGPPVERRFAANDLAQADLIAERVRQLIVEEKLLPHEIVILVSKQPKAAMYKALAAKRLPGSVQWSFEGPRVPNTVLVDTVARFKGLESEAIILWVGSEIAEEKSPETLYVGVTRAKSLLCIIGTQRVVESLSEE